MKKPFERKEAVEAGLRVGAIGAGDAQCRVQRWWCTLAGKACADAMELTAKLTR